MTSSTTVTSSDHIGAVADSTSNRPPRPAGWHEWQAVIDGGTPEVIAERIGMRGLNWMIRAVLDAHYPESVFPQDGVQEGVRWRGSYGGDDIEPGVKWIVLLRMALEEVGAP